MNLPRNYLTQTAPVLVFNSLYFKPNQTKVLLNRLEILKNEFNKLGFDKVFFLDLTFRKNIISKLIHFRTLLNNSTLHSKIKKLGLKNLNFKDISDKKIFLVSENNYHLSNELISEAITVSNKKKLNLFSETITRSNLLYSLRIYSQFLILDFKDFIRVYNAEGFELALRDDPNNFFQYYKINHAVLNINSKNVGSLYRQACKTNLPIQICIETNSGCNYRCIFCPYHGGKQNKKFTFVKKFEDMPLAQVKDIIDQTRELERPYEIDTEVEIVPYRRGELLLYKEWREVIRYIKEKGFRCYFSTNGSLWTQQDIDFVVDVGVDQIQVSLNGHDEETHKLLRLNSEYEKVYNTAKMLVNTKLLKNKTKPHVRLCNTINERNKERIPKYIESYLHQFDGLLLGSENYTDESDSKNYKVEFSPIPPMENKERPPCGMLKDNLWIDANADAILCLGRKIIKLGSLNEMTLNDLITSKKRQEVIMHHAKNELDNDVCKNCQQWFNVYTNKIEYDDYSAEISCSSQNYFTKKKLRSIQ